MCSSKAKRLQRWGARLGLLAIVLQLLAGAVPMPAGGLRSVSPAGPDVAAGASICHAGDEAPVTADPVCPVCFVLCHSAGPLPPEVSGVALSVVPAADLPPGDHAAVAASVRILPARGPPALA
jgi:hypothetical protein